MTTTLQPFTLYRCPTGDGRHGSRWTGALSTPPRPGDGSCPMCGADLVAVVEDGHTYRLTWEMCHPFDGWHPVTRDDTDRAAIVDQYRTLAEWERTGAEPIRNVVLTRSETRFVPYDPDQISTTEGQTP